MRLTYQILAASLDELMYRLHPEPPERDAGSMAASGMELALLLHGPSAVGRLYVWMYS